MNWCSIFRVVPSAGLPVAIFLTACSTAAPDPASQPTSAAAVVTVQPRSIPSGPQSVEVALADVGLAEDALDRSVEPCEDFYSFACGGWLAKTEIPSDRSRWVRSFSEIHKRNEVDLREIAEAATASVVNGTTDIDPVTAKIGAYFGACMNEELINKAGIKPLKPLLAMVRQVQNPRTLARVLAQLHLRRVGAFFDLSALQDFKDATKVIAILDQGGLGLPDRDYYLDEKDPKKAELRATYKKHISRMFRLVGMSAPTAGQAAKDVMRIESALAKVSKTRVERRDPVGMYNKIDISGVRRISPRFAWTMYLRTLGYPALKDINVTAPQFFVGLNRLVVQARPRVLQNYLRWHIVRTYASSLSKPFFDESFSMRQALTGQDEPRPRWKRCVASTDAALGELLAQAFIEKRFAGESKRAAERYVAEIKEAFATNLNNLSWMDQETRTRALKKLEQFTFLIGYPDKWREYTYEIGPVYARNRLASAVFEFKQDLARMGAPVDRERWEMTPPTVNAYYHPLKNQMVFPAGILQPPFYAVDAHVPVNLGAMGMVVGHELTHGFDDQGSQFDGDGNLSMWWTKASRTSFEEKTSCVVSQYEKYEPIEGLPLNGQLTLGENIADIGGLKLAFNAYRSLRSEAKEVKVAGGFTEDQQFFLANAQVWCAKIKDEEQRRRVQIDPHSDAKSRVNGPMSNLSSFAQAFQCEPGTPMNPVDTCSVW